MTSCNARCDYVAIRATIARYRKFAVAAAGAIAVVVSLNLVTGTAESWLIAILAIASAFGVYRAPNLPAKPPAAPTAPLTGSGTSGPGASVTGTYATPPGSPKDTP